MQMTRYCLGLAALAVVGMFSAASAADDHPAVALVKSKVKDPTKPFALLVTIKAKAGKGKDLEATFAPCLAATKKEPGCIAYELNRDPDDPTMYVMYEKFKSVAALEAHLKLEHTVKLLKALESLTDGDIKVKAYVVPD
jgi:quinol monooxygenase YgiN